MKTRALLLGLLWFGSGCNGSVVTETGGGGNSGNGGNGGGATTTSSTVPPPKCPSVAPEAQSACAEEALHCTYGDSPVPSCRPSYTCVNGGWTIDTLGCLEGPYKCPPDVGSEACPAQGDTCVTDTSFCICGPCGGAGCPPEPWSWVCAQGTDPGCPALLPNDGAACDAPEQVCNYGVMCADFVTARCIGGAWDWDDPLACP